MVSPVAIGNVTKI